MIPDDHGQEMYDQEITVFYRKWAGKVLAFLISVGVDRGLAEEITQDAFVGARQRWEHVRTLDEPEGYIFKIAKNERSKRQPKHEDNARDLHPDPPAARRDRGTDLAQGVADRAALWRALQELTVGQREAVVLRHVFGFPEAVAARIMGIGTGCLKRYTHEGRRRLRPLLAEFRDQ